MKPYNAMLILLAALTIGLQGCAQGPSGATGAQGPQGVQGVPGNPGRDGSWCSATNINPNAQYPNGAALVACTDGSYAYILNGTDGQNGSNGTDGLNGIDAMPIQPVQFCPNDAPSYPDAFPEVGFCLAGKMYGVYSMNGGFMTYLPPGAYNSNAVGSACNFNINADCSISN